MSPVTYVMTAHLPETGIDAFLRYEEAVLPLLAGHGGRLARRLRSADRRTELHIVEFDSAEGFAGYRADQRRLELQPLLDGAGARIELVEMTDV